MSGPRRCLLCGGSRHAVVFHEFGVDVLRCRGCGHVFSGHEAPADYDGYWGHEVRDPGERFWLDAHRPMYEDFFRRIVTRPEGRLLDVGCGVGWFVREMQARFPGWETHGYEISAAAVRYAREVLRLENVQSGRVEESAFPPGCFDVVTLWDVLEHLREPDGLLRWVHGALRSGGVCFLHTPNVTVQLAKARLQRALRGMQPGGHYLEARDHLHLYSPRTLRSLLARNGFGDVRLVHLHPIQNVFASQTPAARLAKNAWFHAARMLDAATAGRVNLDNLFAVARKGPAGYST